MGIASIAMYVSPEPLAEATAALWSFLRDRLAAAGLAGVPDTLDWNLAYDAAWLRPDLLLSQTCGYPYVRHLRDRVRLVATPAYSHPGCSGALMRSFIIAGRDAGIHTLEDLRGTVAAINSPDSNSGANLFRAAIAPLAVGSPFFADVLQTGSHGASIDAVAQGAADCAAIDCITFANIHRFDPERVEAVRIVGETPSGPGLPFITAADASDRKVALIRDALGAAIGEASLAPVRETLGLVDFVALSDADYEPLLAFARHAEEAAFHDFDVRPSSRDR